MSRRSISFLFLNLGHFYDHLFMLIFATVAALALAYEWGMTYSALIPYATPGFVAFGVGAIPAGWIADKWSREAMMAVFFLGIGVSSLATALADTPVQIAIGLFAIGVFASIYHPVGIAMVVEGRARVGVPLAVNGIFGNMGVAAAALVSGFLIDAAGWRAAFAWPGAVAAATGIAYVVFVLAGRRRAAENRAAGSQERPASGGTGFDRRTVVRVFAIICFSTALGGLIFQSTTFALPKIFGERLGEMAGSATEVGGYAFIVFAAAAFAQLAVGHLLDRVPVRLVFAGIAALQMALFAAMHDLTGPAALFVSAGFMLAVFGQIPINDVLVARVARGDWRSRAYALRYIITFSVSATTVPLIAWLHAEWGFAGLFLVLAAAAALVLAAVLMLPAVPATARPSPAAAAAE